MKRSRFGLVACWAGRLLGCDGCGTSTSFFLMSAVGCPLFGQRFEDIRRLIANDGSALSHGANQSTKDGQSAERQVCAAIVDPNLGMECQQSLRRLVVLSPQFAIFTARNNSKNFFFCHFSRSPKSCVRARNGNGRLQRPGTHRYNKFRPIAGRKAIQSAGNRPSRITVRTGLTQPLRCGQPEPLTDELVG